MNHSATGSAVVWNRQSAVAVAVAVVVAVHGAWRAGGETFVVNSCRQQRRVKGNGAV